MHSLATPVRSPDLASPRRRWRRLTGLCLVLAACSKGGQPDQDPNCRNLADQPMMSGGLPALPPRALYAELRSVSGATIGVMLDGTGGLYKGAYAMAKCDAPDTYAVERVALVDASLGPVAIATRNTGTNGYTVAFQRGGSVLSASFPSIALTYTGAGTMPTVSVQGITGVASTAKLGDLVTAQIALSDSTCGVRESQWWLASTPGSTKIGEPAVLAGGSGTVSLRVPPRLALPANLYVEGQVTLSSGRIYQIRRTSPTDMNYHLYDPRSGALVGEAGQPATTIAISDNPDADKTPPRPSLLEVNPASASRCDQVTVALHMIDDKGLPAMQNVKLWLGTLEKPQLTSIMLTGADVLTGSLHVPADAPFGVWYGYPDTVRDYAGNVATGKTMGNGQFVVSDGTFTSLPIMEATFIVPNKNPQVLPDLGLGGVDGGVPTVDMATSAAPARLDQIAVSPAAVAKEGDMFTVTVNWTDLSMPQILK